MIESLDLMKKSPEYRSLLFTKVLNSGDPQSVKDMVDFLSMQAPSTLAHSDKMALELGNQLLDQMRRKYLSIDFELGHFGDIIKSQADALCKAIENEDGALLKTAIYHLKSRINMIEKIVFNGAEESREDS